ncbi:MAG: RNA methyltransferase [Culturomica sp.]|jgi:tRNA (guanosine-2'-O-)-methyltransferase|nr:RNA methyltransferase [Culturomica sp.]
MKSIREQVEYLKGFVTDERRKLLERMLGERTEYVTVVLEDLFQSHNQSAVMRTADCMGIQHLHVIENRNRYDAHSSVSRGAQEWLTLHRYNRTDDNTPEAIGKLRAAGYRIVATTPHTEDVGIDELDLQKGKVAFFFGTEWLGLSETVMKEADEFVKVPMYGFTESLNVSVCAALVLYSTVRRLRTSGIAWHLPEEEALRVALQWYKKSVRSSSEILERFNRE